MLLTNHSFKTIFSIVFVVSAMLLHSAPGDAASTKAKYENKGEIVTIECELIKKGRLRYPPRAKRFNFVGEVTVGFSISPEGQVLDPHVIDSSPPGLFEKSALKHVRSWLYNPPTFEGQPVQANDAKVKIVFRPS